jgi:hypothetical protein
MEDGRMKNRTWFDAGSQAETTVGFVQSLFAPWRRATPPVEVLTARSPSRYADQGADASWTASLNRGDGLPPFLLCIDMAAGKRSAIRFQPFARPTGADSSVR